MSLWLVGKNRSITLMAPQSASGTAMKTATRIAISRLVILFIFLPASNRYLRRTLVRNILLPREPAPRDPGYSAFSSPPGSPLIKQKGRSKDGQFVAFVIDSSGLLPAAGPKTEPNARA